MARLIPEAFIAEYTEAQKQLIADLSREIVVGFGSSDEVDCPNCRYDGVSGSSGAQYTAFTGSVVLFAGTPNERTFEAIPFRKVCPVCGGKGFFSVPREESIMAHVKWNAKQPDGTYPDSTVGSEGQDNVRLKTNSLHYEDLLAAKYFVIDGTRVLPYSVPVIRGMQGTDGIVEIWCRTTDSGKETVGV
jgi:hypothetical protein